MKKVFLLLACVQLLTSCEDILSQISIKPIRPEGLICSLDSTELDGWDEGFLINNDIYILFAEDSVWGTIAYFNQLDKDFNEGLLIEFDERNLISRIHDHEYIHSLKFSEDSLSVASIPVDTASNKAIKLRKYAFDYKDYYNEAVGLTRAKSSTMDKLSMYYFLHSTGVKIEISDKEIWQTVAQAIVEEALQEGLTKGVAKAAGKFAGAFVGATWFAVDVITLYDEVEKYTYFGHARLNVVGCDSDINPKEFSLDLKNLNTLPSPSKYGVITPFEYECGVMLDGKQLVGPIHFLTGQNVNLGTYDIPELNTGQHQLIPYLVCRNSGMKVLGQGASFFVYNEKPEYSVKVKNVEYKDGVVAVELDVKWAPVESSYVEFQGISFTKSNGDMFCPNLSDVHGGNAPHINDTDGEFCRSEFELDYTEYIAKTNIKIEYYTKFYHSVKTFHFPLEDFEVVYNQEPSITFMKPAIIGTEIIDYDEDNNPTRYCTNYEFEIDVKGCFWFSNAQYQIVSGNWINYWDMQSFPVDDNYKMYGYLEYNSNSELAHSSYYQMFLYDGSSKSSTNSLLFGGVPSCPTVTLGGALSNTFYIKEFKETTCSKKNVVNSCMRIFRE